MYELEKNILKKSEFFIQGVSDYLFIPKGKKDIRNKCPDWMMKFKLHQKEWQEGYNYAKSLDLST